MFRLPLMQQVSWDADKDFTYIVHLTGYTFGVTTNAESQFKTWKDVVEFAKANPGKVTYATPGAGTSLHICMEQIAALAGVKLTQVPFKGGAETNAAVLGKHTMLQADSTGWRPLVDAGEAGHPDRRHRHSRLIGHAEPLGRLFEPVRLEHDRREPGPGVGPHTERGLRAANGGERFSDEMGRAQPVR